MFKFVSQQSEQCVFRAWLRLRTFYFGGHKLMKQKLRKITSVLLAMIMISVIAMSSITASALNQSEFDSKLNSLRSKYPNYSTWYSSFDGGSQCFGFARLMGYEVFGSYPSTWSVSYDFNSVKAGDIVRYGNNGSGGHSIFVTSVSGSTITFVDCNGNGNYSGATKVRTCGIKWDNTTTIGSSLFGYSFSYIRKCPGIESYMFETNGNITAFGYDYPTENQVISDKTFLFQGWVNVTKSISSITCSINDGQKYFTASLYTRSDVPGATAFRTEIPTINLNMGNNKVAVCVNYTDGTGDVAGYRTVTRTRPDYTYGFDNPAEGEHINDSTFLFQGWVDADKKIEKITCSINDGERYFEAALYTRPDVPNAVAFRREIYSDYLSYGENHISVCLTYADGTSVTIARKTIYKTYNVALDNPLDSEFILDDKFLFQGWVESEKEIKSIKCLINNETYLNTALYKRPDVPNATAYRLETKRSYLINGENSVEVYVEYKDGTNMKLLKRNIYNFEKVDLGTDFEAYIEHTDSQKVLSVDNDDNVIINNNNKSDNQVWTFLRNENGSYTIISKYNKKCLDNYAASGTSKSNVQVYEQNNTNAQHWYILKGTTSYYLMPVCSNKCCIDLAQNDATDGTNIRLYDFNDTYAQKYNIVKTSFDIGDVNGDENINITDTTAIQKHIASINTLDENALIRADVNSDSSVDINDATLIQQYCAGLIDKF